MVNVWTRNALLHADAGSCSVHVFGEGRRGASKVPDELIRCHQNWLDLSSDVSFHLCMLPLEQRQFLTKSLLLLTMQISSHLLSGTTSEKPASVFILPLWRQTY